MNIFKFQFYKLFNFINQEILNKEFSRILWFRYYIYINKIGILYVIKSKIT